MEIIRIEGIAKSYGSHQVHKDLSLSIVKGECFTLLGPSGCGKTVLLRLIAGFETPDAGRISIDNTVGEEREGDAAFASSIGTNLSRLSTAEMSVLGRHGAALLTHRLRTYVPEIIPA